MTTICNPFSATVFQGVATDLKVCVKHLKSQKKTSDGWLLNPGWAQVKQTSSTNNKHLQFTYGKVIS